MKQCGEQKWKGATSTFFCYYSAALFANVAFITAIFLCKYYIKNIVYNNNTENHFRFLWWIVHTIAKRDPESLKAAIIL